MHIDYVVQPGDNLSSIAAHFGTTTQAVADANGIANPDLIRAGWSLRIPFELHWPPTDAITTNRNVWKQVLKWKELEDWGPPPTNSVSVKAIPGHQLLVEVPMYFAAYQGGSRYYIVNTLVTPNKAHELIFPQHGVNEHGQKSLSVTPILSGLVSFNYPHLTAFMKGRGVGDIGTVSVYDITDGSARLVELRERNDADEPGNPGDPGTWPLKDLGTLSL